MAEKRLFKEYNQLLKISPSQTNPQILSLVPKDQDNLFEWEALIFKPSADDSAYYHGGKWTLDISVSPQYPIVPPRIKFASTTPICHPNINIETGEICLDILKNDQWSPAWSLQYLVLAVLMLIDEPEPDSPLNIDLANLYRYDKVAFESMVQYFMWKYGTLDGRESRGVKSGAEEDEPEPEMHLESDEETVNVAEVEAEAAVPETETVPETVVVPETVPVPVVVPEVSQETKQEAAVIEPAAEDPAKVPAAPQPTALTNDASVKSIASSSPQEYHPPEAESHSTDTPGDAVSTATSRTSGVSGTSTGASSQFLAEDQKSSSEKDKDSHLTSPSSVNKIRKSLSIKSFRSDSSRKKKSAKERLKHFVRHED